MTTHPQYSKEELVLLLRSGNEHAFNQIYTLYWRKLYALAYQRLRNKQAAEDVVQEVLAGVWQRRTTSLINNLEAYLATATRYAVIRQLGKEHAVTTETEQASDLTTDEMHDTRLLWHTLQKEIHKLPEKCRLVFQYSRELGLTNKEIADSLDISQKAVEKHITKAIRALRDHLKLFSFYVIKIFSF
ncbi:sigma-70 family RNA polymerase sigma factor [Filimonas lacunae]|nr:sigma-70 family RNA polymerase sigma factor [Filimonas lacunae]BAV05126.1 RNA polymerase ECF-type sigma factor [Filimonas lacunae]